MHHQFQYVVTCQLTIFIVLYIELIVLLKTKHHGAKASVTIKLCMCMHSITDELHMHKLYYMYMLRTFMHPSIVFRL